jgi:hypothetical protein
MAYRFNQIQPSAGFDLAMAAVNRNFQRLDKEAVTKIVKGPNNTNAILFGLRPDGTFGIDFSDSNGTLRATFGQTAKGFALIIYDPDGTSRVLIGNAPDDGRAGEWISKPGIDVIQALGG